MMYINSLLFTLAAVISAISAAHSPALLWSPERSMVELPDISHDSFTASDFYSQYLNPVMHDGKGSSVVFLQDKLSVEDFTKYADVFSIDSDGGAFKNIKRLVDEHFSLEIPQVDSPHIAIDSLKQKFDGKVHVINHPAELDSLHLGKSDRFLLIVNLHPIIGAKDVEKTITQNDAIVGDVTQHLHDQGIEYAALFTGKSAEVPEEEDFGGEPTHTGRHLLATVNAAPTGPCAYQNVSDIMVYLCSFKVCLMPSSKDNSCAFHINKTLDNTTDIASTSTKVNDTAMLTLVFKDEAAEPSGDLYDIEVNIATKLRGDRWTMDRFSFNLSPGTGSKGNITFENMTLKDISLDTTVPRLFSFHCTQLKLNLNAVNESDAKYAGSFVQLNKFQFQVFDVRSNGFFSAQDCVGFFTSAIWMGIVPGLLMVGILIWGTSMVLSLSVMDKFDNPKGKTISINTGE